MSAQASLLDLLFAPDATAAGGVITAAANPPRRVSLHFWRCADCLSVCTVDATYTKLLCGACGGSLEYMGRTSRDRLVKDELRCPCDGRCTSARGPVCDCHCGGVNHGSQMLVLVTVDAGPVPVAAVAPAGKYAADHYRGLVEAVRAAVTRKYGRVLELKKTAEYLGGSDYSEYCQAGYLLADLRAARAMRSHSGRNKKLLGLLKMAGGVE